MRDLLTRLETFHGIAKRKGGLDQLIALAQRAYHGRKLVPGQPPLEIPPGTPQPAAHIEAAQAEYLTVMASKGTGKEEVEDRYLVAIGAAADRGSVPFWRALLGHSEKGRLTKIRVEYALSALAFLVAIRRDQAALALLVEACRGEKPLTRGIAAQLAVLAHPAPKRKKSEADDIEPTDGPAYRPPPEVIEAVLDVARDKNFEARFLARRALEWIAHEVPRNAPDGLYSFEVRLRAVPSVRRVIELHSSQTLNQLGVAILDSIEWEHDHPHAFFFGKDASFVLSPSDFDDNHFDLDVAVGDLGLVTGRKFVYLFDFGEKHRFDVQLVSIAENIAPLSEYPRVAQQEGASPKQYRDW